MRHFAFLLTIILSSVTFAFSQEHGFPFGKATYREVESKVYEKDTTAAAVVLNEFGEAYIDNNNDNNLIFEYHVKIKILKQSAADLGDVEIPIRKSDKLTEKLLSVKASSFNIDNGVLKEYPIDQKQIFTENSHRFRDVKKFVIPNVKAGTVIEYAYKLESPFTFNWRTWYFQSDIPKISSEYWTLIPANFNYNISLRGYLKLTKDVSEVIKECYTPGGGAMSSCVLSKYAMKDIPALKHEQYMTARSNYLASLNYELSEYHYFSGRTDKFTKTWKDAEQEMAGDSRFGVQIKRGKDILDGHVDDLLATETDPLVKAKKIYNFIKGWYQWNDIYGIFSDLGIKKAFDQKTGNVADINLSLVAACLYAGINAEPVLVSTRANGFPVELYPVLTDFNYVVARVNIGDKSYLLDATEDDYPFGLLPERCLNGKGRVMGANGSSWIELKPADRMRETAQVNLKLEKDGMLRGSINIMSSGYEAVDERQRINKFSNHDDYIKDLARSFTAFEIKSYEIKNATDIDKPLTRKLDVEARLFETNERNVLFNPFLLKKWTENPFKSDERLFPVDFGMPLQYVTITNIEFDPSFEIANAPEKVGLTLPNGGGSFVYEMQNGNGKLTVSNSIIIAKTLFPSTEYFHLKELYARMIQVQNTDLIIKRNTGN